MKRRRLGDLVLTDKQKQRADGISAVGFLDMHPDDFLTLTTASERQKDWIRSEAAPLDHYNRWAAEGETVVPPFLDVDRHTGEVCRHEGRHRSAALLRDDPGRSIPVAVVLRGRGCRGPAEYFDEKETKRGFRRRFYDEREVPDTLCGQYDRKRCVQIDKAAFRPLRRRGWHDPDG